MRRGHTGIGGWRNEKSRPYRPVGGNPHFRPARSYGLLDTPRFPPPCPRPTRQQHYNTRSEKFDRPMSDRSDRHRYRNNQHYDAYQAPHHQGERHKLPTLHWSRRRNERSTSKDPPKNFYKNPHVEHFHVNSMGDVDHRHIPQRKEMYIPPLMSPWATEQPLQHTIGKEHNNLYRQDKSQTNKQLAASVEYTGHRPPASDHYGCNPTPVIDNSHTFSRSVDDTVDLIRKRLLNRSDPQSSSDTFENCQNNLIEDIQKIETDNNFQHNQVELPMRKKCQRQPLMDNSNCAKIKNKIVHQLFKMDKEKIHKLMDNPNSSNKFEYAISSLITESQNSFNRHLRSAAEKSLCSSSTEFIQNDNNTIYEDTFMKQMQCILDPQDTVFLEDIKPFVMAELTKVLQLNEYEHIGDEGTISENHSDHLNYSPYPSDIFYHEDFLENNYSDCSNHLQADYHRSKSVEPIINNYDAFEDNGTHYEETKSLFERRQRTKSFNCVQDTTMSDTPFYESKEDIIKGDVNRSEVTKKLFDANAEQFSEDEDPFAELDKQYHVEVDHDFIESDDISSLKQDKGVYNSHYAKEFKTEPLSPEKSVEKNDKAVEIQLHDMVKPAVTFPLTNNNATVFKQEQSDMSSICKVKLQEALGSAHNFSLQENNISNYNENIDKKFESESKEMIKTIDNTDASTNLKSTSSNSRKRSTDQRPSHRKEKRKKTDPSSDASKQILNKNIIINVNDCASKTSDKCETSKSIFNLFFAKEESKPISKDNKNVSSNSKNYSEKHVKRKETPKKSTDRDNRNRRKDSTSTSQPLSPTDNNNVTTGEILIKLESKTTLKPIDMFNEQPRKISIHQAHRNTAPTASSASKIEINKIKPKEPLSRPLLKKHIAVQAVRKVHSKETQTSLSNCCGTQLCQSKQKLAVKAVQTDVDIPEKTGNKSNDAFERMKEIDLEIQILLQEKFKLYSSIEANDSGKNSMQTLGMTVLNVSPYNGDGENDTTEEMLREDTIVNDFTNIPVEELEQIALETVQEQETEPQNVEIRNRRRKISEQHSVEAQSPVTIQKKKNMKLKSPNISLIEQIITDERPLEDIISLDDLEIPQTKKKGRNRKTKQTTKKKGTGKSRVVERSTVDYTLKECSVVLIRTDITQYLKQMLSEIPNPEMEHENVIIEESNSDVDQNDIETCLNNIYEQGENVVDETVVNDIQFDMLDVSEDIVVGESCEIKYLDDKDYIENVAVPVNDEIILDNSQSSVEDASTTAMDQGDECKMYDYSSDENLRRDSIVVNGNADAVLAIECVENNFLAACLDGNVYYFNGDGQLITTLRGSNLAVTCITLVKEKYGTTVYTGSLDSRIRYYDLQTGLEKGPECNVLSPIQTMDRAWDTVFVGTKTGFVLQFECKNNMLIPVSSVKFSDQSILALRAMKEGPRKVLLVAARSENVTIKDAQTGLLLRTLIGPMMTVYNLLYEDGKVYCGTSTHQIHVFDYASGSHVGTHEGGKGAVCLRASGGLLFAGCYDGCVYVYRESEGRPFAQIRGPSLMLLSLAVVGSKIIAGYKDRSLYIWKMPLSILQEMIL